MDRMQQLDLEELVDELRTAIRSYKDNSGFITRDDVVNIAKRIIKDVEEPEDKVFGNLKAAVEAVTIKSLMKMRVFERIPEEGSISISDLAKDIGADVSLLRRLVRLMVATGMLAQEGDCIAHTRFSRIYVAGNPMGFTSYLSKYGFKEPISPLPLPHSFAYGMEHNNFWDTLSTDPERLEAFNLCMQRNERDRLVLGAYDLSWMNTHIGSPNDARPLIVDIGGGKGHVLQRIIKAYPSLPRARMILQDRPDVISEVKKIDEPSLREITKMELDFFKEQPVKGALVYYMRRCLHDWTDTQCHTILSHLSSAMSPDSRLLVVERVMEEPSSERTAWFDLTMMMIGGKERTENEWRELLGGEGLDIVKIWKNEGTDVCLIEAVKV
ncbi:MAG: hypothetical protein M1834_005558 [Cirrosporium novae-zelandiae]|nr:MAG: hypothetical protein M1834_005558 [Cirrosporium novae-zelandiae]